MMDSLDLAEAELAEMREHKQRAAPGTQRRANPLLLGLSPYKYLIRALRMVKAPDLEQALLVMPFHYVGRFVAMLLEVCSYLLHLP